MKNESIQREEKFPNLFSYFKTFPFSNVLSHSLSLSLFLPLFLSQNYSLSPFSWNEIPKDFSFKSKFTFRVIIFNASFGRGSHFRIFDWTILWHHKCHMISSRLPVGPDYNIWPFTATKKCTKSLKVCQSRFKILPNDYQRTFKHHQIWMLCMQTLESLFIWESCGHSKQKHQSKGTKSWKWAYMYYPELIQLVKYITYSLWGRLHTSNLFYLGRSNDCWLARSWCRVSYPRTIYSQFNLYNQIFGWSWIVCIADSTFAIWLIVGKDFFILFGCSVHMIIWFSGTYSKTISGFHVMQIVSKIHFVQLN